MVIMLRGGGVGVSICNFVRSSCELSSWRKLSSAMSLASSFMSVLQHLSCSESWGNVLSCGPIYASTEVPFSGA